jgi:hypothetical protein
MIQLNICFCLLPHVAGYAFYVADYQSIECHAKLPQPPFCFDREQFRYNEENAIFDNIGNLSSRILLFFTLGIQHYIYAPFSGILSKCKHVYRSLNFTILAPM